MKKNREETQVVCYELYAACTPVIA